MRRFLVLLLLTVPLTAQERLVLNNPVYASAGVRNFRVQQLFIQRGTSPLSTSPLAAQISASFLEVDDSGTFIEGGRVLRCMYDGETAETIIVALNKAHLSSNSLERRIITAAKLTENLGLVLLREPLKETV